MKNLKAVLLTFLICIFTVNVCYADGMENMLWVFKLIIVAIISALIYIINLIFIVWGKWLSWVIVSSYAILFINLIYFIFDSDFITVPDFFNEKSYLLLPIVFLIIIVFHSTNIYQAKKKIKKNNKGLISTK